MFTLKFQQITVIHGQRSTIKLLAHLQAKLTLLPHALAQVECLVRIVSAVDKVEIDRSDNVFSIVPPSALITKPAAIDPIYLGGKKSNIEWTVEDASQVRFEFSEDGAI